MDTAVENGRGGVGAEPSSPGFGIDGGADSEKAGKGKRGELKFRPYTNAGAKRKRAKSRKRQEKERGAN